MGSFGPKTLSMKSAKGSNIIIVIVAIIVTACMMYLFYQQSTHTSTLDDYMLVSEAMTLSSNEVQNDDDHWKEKFASILADSSKNVYASAYVLTTHSVADIVSYIDATNELLNGNDSGKNIDLVNQVMIKGERASRLKILIFDALFLIEFFDVWSEYEQEELMGNIPLSLEYNKNNAVAKGGSSWETYHFEDVPVVAARVLLNKFRNDALNTQEIVLEQLYEKATAQTK